MKKAHEMKKVKALSFNLDEEEEEENEGDDKEEKKEEVEKEEEEHHCRGKKNSEQSTCSTFIGEPFYVVLLLGFYCLLWGLAFRKIKVFFLLLHQNILRPQCGFCHTEMFINRKCMIRIY